MHNNKRMNYPIIRAEIYRGSTHCHIFTEKPTGINPFPNQVFRTLRELIQKIKFTYKTINVPKNLTLKGHGRQTNKLRYFWLVKEK